MITAIKNFIPLIILLSFVSCNSMKQPSAHAGVKHSTKEVIIASYKAPCTGVAPQMCFLYKENQEDEWKYFYSKVDGFDYEEGYEYVIKVKVKSDGNSYMDASDLKFIFVELISKEKKVVTISPLYDSWGLLELNGVSVDIAKLMRSPLMDINTQKKKINASTGCNSFSTSFEYDDERLFKVKFPFPITEMACENSIEKEFLIALESVDSYKTNGLDLILLANGAVVLKYRKLD